MAGYLSANSSFVINCLVANWFLRKAMTFSSLHNWPTPIRRGVVAFTVAAFLRRSGDELAVRSGREPLVREAPAQLAGATRRWR